MRRAVALLHRVAGVALLAVTVLAVPVLLRRLLGGPIVLLSGLRNVNWGRVDGTDSRALVIACLGLLLWLTWARAAASALVAVMCRLLQLRVPRLPLLGTSQTLVAVLLGGAVVTGTTPPGTAVAPVPAHASPAVVGMSVQSNGVRVGWVETGVLATGIASVVGISRRHQRRRAGRVTTSAPTPEPPRSIAVSHDEIQMVKHLLHPVVPSSVLASLASTDAAAGELVRLPTWTFMVRLLGPVDVLARNHQAVVFERAKLLELLAWLVLHRRSATSEAARAALWEAEVRDTSFANVVSGLRRALASHTPDGNQCEWVGRSRGERLVLHPEVVSDVELFQVHVARAKHRAGVGESSDAVGSELRMALELVRGAPFIGSGFGWADSEATTSNFTLLVVSTAVELAERALRNDGVDEAFWATSVGLSVLPGHEELVALRLRTHAHAGDAVGLRHEWHTYVRSLLSDPWQTEPSPWMTDLVRELLDDTAIA